MKQKNLLRIASIVMLLHTTGHTMAALTWDEAPDSATGRVIDSMKNNYFEFAGRSVSLAKFYAGYGYAMILVLLLVSIVLWMLSSDAAGKLSRQIQVCMTMFLLLFSITEWIYFFPLAGAFSLVAGIITGIAVLKKQPG